MEDRTRYRPMTGWMWWAGCGRKPDHTQPTTPKRSGLMMAAPLPAWSVFKQIFVDHWEGFKRVHPRYDTRYYDGLVDKMLGCGNPEKMGYIAYRCGH
jgi:hypothetical protein